jgi:small ligand-binding sensory domain FIST
MAAMLEARRYADQANMLMATMTAAFAAAQLLGPLAVGLAASQGIQSTAGPSLLAAAGPMVSAWILQKDASELPHSTIDKAAP